MTDSPFAQLSDVDIRLLRVFRVVVESGGISAAELELNIGRSTISRHIKDIEIRLGVTLCRRGRSGFSLTREGKLIYQATLRLFGSLEEFRSEVNEIHRRMTGHISLALFDKTVTNPTCNIYEALRSFYEAAPEVSLEIYVEPLNEIERGVMEGRFQLGVIPGHRKSSSLSYLPLFDEQMRLYCGQDHPLFERDGKSISSEDIISSRYAGLGYHSPNMEVGRRLGLRRSVTVYDQEAIAHLLLSGTCIGHLPDHYALPFTQSGLIRPIAEGEFSYKCEFLAITRKSPKPSRIVATLLECLKESHSGSSPKQDVVE